MPINEDLSNVDIALYAMHLLGGTSKKIHTEKIAVQAYNLSEERFSWILPEFRKLKYPDKTTARYALESAKKIRLVKGRAGRDKGGSESEGWQFTPVGVDWILKNEERIRNKLKIEKPISLTLPKHQAERFIKNIRSEKLFQLYYTNKSLDDASVYNFTDMLSCSPDASKEVIRQKFDIIKSNAFAINDNEVKGFLDKCEKKFKDLLIN